MQELLRKIRQILRDRRTRKLFARAVMSTAAIVVFVTTYALILPAITLENTAVCGIEEHQHNDSCYEEMLVCGQEESEGHRHGDSCYLTTRKLTCEIQGHWHSDENRCFDADGNLVCRLQEHVHDDSCYEEFRTLTCGQEEGEGHHHTYACYEKKLTCGKEVHTHSEKCYEEGGNTDASADGSSDSMLSNPAVSGETEDTGTVVSDSEDSESLFSEEEAQPDRYVPELDPLDMEAVLNSHTDFYYFHAEQGEEIPADSAEITDWRKVDKDTKLASADLVKMYLAYSIPAGSLNETNPSARYRLPDNLHLSDEQIEAMNRYENGIAAGYRDSGSSSEKDEKDKETENYKKYLGAEAVEGVRRPDEQPEEGAQEFISAVVRAENVYDDKGHYLGQNLIFTFVPYSIEKNQDNYDADMTLISAGEEITGWFACDFRLDQIDWEQEEVNEEDNKEEGSVPEDKIEEYTTVILAREDQDKEILEISCVLKMTGEVEEIGENSENGETEDNEAYKATGENGKAGETEGGESAGTKKDSQMSKHVITADGKDYLVTVTYESEAEIPQGAELAVRELLPGTEEYNQHLQAVEDKIHSGKQEDDTVALTARFFDITILSDGVEIQPSAPVDVRIELTEKVGEDLQVFHFDDKSDDVEELQTEEQAPDIKDSTVQFSTESFSVFAIVGTVIEKNVLASDGKNYKVTVTYGGETGIPEGAELAVEEILPDENGDASTSSVYDEYVSKTENALGMEEGTAGYIRLFDIKIVEKDDHSVKYQPAAGTAVDMRIELADAVDGKALNVVHFADGSAEGDKVENSTENSEDGSVVEFAADGFSVYAVVGDEEYKEDSRVTVNFFGKDTNEPIATVYVKNSDTADEIEQIVFDPGCGELASKEMFDSWVISTVNTTDGSTYTIDTEGTTIEGVRDYLAHMDINEGDVVNVYAKIVKAITISYIGETPDIILGSTIVKVLGDDSIDYEISMNYTPETAEQAFMGWKVSEGASSIKSAISEGETVEPPYPNGTTITIDGDVTLSVNAPSGHWLVFDENGKGATYHAPQFIEEGNVTQEPSGEMTRLGYTFGGWYTDKDCTVGNEFTFGSELTDNTTIYAKWTEAATANYTVIVWKERMTDTYAENGGTGEGKEKNYDFSESYTLVGNVGAVANAVSNGTSSVVDGDPSGTRYYNARIRGTSSGGGNIDQTVSYTGYHCANYDTDVEITPEGNTVINVYYDRNTVTYTFYTYGESSTSGAWWLCKENGDHIKQSGQNATSSDRIATRSGNDYSQYTGRIEYGDGKTYYYSTTGACTGTQMREAHWEYATSSGSQWNVYQEEIGLYGESLNWPTDTSIWWYEGHNSTSGTGTRMTYKDAFLPLDNDMTVEYWGNTASASGTIHFWTQDVDGGNSYTDQVQVATGNANFNINDKFTGFYAYQYRTDNGAWQNVGTFNESTGIYGSPVSYNNRLDIRYNRIKAAITFLDGSYFDGNGNRQNEDPQAEAFYTSPEYYYEADVSSYNKNGTDYYTPPEKTGYTFAGWYADDACTVEYDFTTMPASGITVYAKWIQNQYRVFLHPNVPESDTTLTWGSDDQDMNFRVSSGDTVSTPTGTRSEYKLIGWYLDEACTQVFDAEHYILNDTSVTTPYDKAVDMTDEMNKYGNIVGEGSNSDAQNNRFWINKKLDLYAKWRAELIGAEGIGVKYDANGGSNAPDDTKLYLDNSDTVAQGATTPPDENQQFLYWVLQRWDEEEGKYVDIEGEDNKIYPGATFTVLKSNAYVEELEESTEDDPKYRYTVQLRAEYGPKEEPTPTHIWWFPNNVEAERHEAVKADDDLQVNETVTIPDPPAREGYEFLGWARVSEDTSESRQGENDSMPTAKVLNNLEETDLFLTYHKAEGESAAHYTAVIDGIPETVTRVAADERIPYQDLYAVWKKKTYTVTVTKVVNGLDSDSDIPFTFIPSFTGMSTDYNNEFRLVGNQDGADIDEGEGTVHIDHSKSFIEVPYETVFSITEEILTGFDVYETYEITNADNESENKSVMRADNGAEVVVKGDVALYVVNTRKSQPVRVLKTELDGETPLDGAVFTITIDGTEYTFNSDADGYLKNETFSDGIISVPFGTYTLTETTPPEGYIGIGEGIIIRIDAEGVHTTSYHVKEPTEDEDYYTIIVPNNPGVVLPATGGSGVKWIYLLGFCMVAIGAISLAIKKRSENGCT